MTGPGADHGKSIHRSVSAHTYSGITTDQGLRYSTALRASVFYPSGGLLDTGLWTSDRNRPADLARERPRETPAMTIDGLKKMASDAGKELPLQPLDELARLVIDGIRDERFIMILPTDSTEVTLRERLERVLANENPTTSHALGL